MGRKLSPLGVRLRAYPEVRRLAAGGVTSPSSIRRELLASGIGAPSRETIRRWVLSRVSPTGGMRTFEPKPSEDLSFFIGAWLGDGWADDNDGGKRMLLKVRSYDFAKEFADVAARLLNKHDSYWVRRINKNGRWYLVKVTSVLLYDFMNQPAATLLDYVEPCPRGFLRGFFTAEGNPSVAIERTVPPYLSVGLAVSNASVDLIDFTRETLVQAGFHPGRRRITTRAGKVTNVGVARRPVWTLSLSTRADAARFASQIGFADSEKQTKLIQAISLIDALGRFRAANEWTKLNVKLGRKWVRRA